PTCCFLCRVISGSLLLVFLLHVAPVPDDRSVRAEPRVLEHDTFPGANFPPHALSSSHSRTLRRQWTLQFHEQRGCQEQHGDWSPHFADPNTIQEPAMTRLRYRVGEERS